MTQPWGPGERQPATGPALVDLPLADGQSARGTGQEWNRDPNQQNNRTLGRIVETNEVFGPEWVVHAVRVLATVEEFDEPIAVLAGITIELGQTTDDSEAFPLTWVVHSVLPIGRAAHVDVARPLSANLTCLLGLVTENDAPFTVLIREDVTIALASMVDEFGEAFSLTRSGALTVSIQRTWETNAAYTLRTTAAGLSLGGGVKNRGDALTVGGRRAFYT